MTTSDPSATITAGVAPQFVHGQTHTLPLSLVRFQPDPARLSIDEARLLPRSRASASPLLDRERMERAQAAALVGAAAVSPEAALPRATKAEPGDLRGIPVIGRGVGGVSPGTSPESAIDRIDRDVAARRRVVIDPAGPREPMVAYG